MVDTAPRDPAASPASGSQRSSHDDLRLADERQVIPPVVPFARHAVVRVEDDFYFFAGVLRDIDGDWNPPAVSLVIEWIDMKRQQIFERVTVGDTNPEEHAV